MTSLPDRIVLHLGAHKTASTHLQHSLAAADLDGVAFFSPPKLRDPGDSLPERFGFPLDPATATGSDRPVRDVLTDMANGRRRLVMSDENFAGKIQTGWGKIPTPLYFTAEKRLAALTKAVTDAGGPGVDLCLAIRDPAAYLTSCYSQILHGGRVVKPAKFKTKNPLEIVDWVDYAHRLRGIAGVNRLTLWRYEDYAAVFPQICENMVGTPAVTPLQARMQVRLSQEAYQAVMTAKAAGAKNNVAAAVAAYPVSDTAPPFTLYDADEQAASAAHYAVQWRTLATVDGVTCLSVR